MLSAVSVKTCKTVIIPDVAKPHPWESYPVNKRVHVGTPSLAGLNVQNRH